MTLAGSVDMDEAHKDSLEVSGALPDKSDQISPFELVRRVSSRRALMSRLRKHLPLGEDERQSRLIEERAGILESVPMQCNGPQCPLASRCPVSQNPAFIGTPCVLQTVEVYRHFRDYVLSLQIDPTEYADLQMVVDLVRTHVLSWWIDQLLAIEGIMQTNVTISGNRTTTTRVSHPLIAEQRALIRERNLIYKELLASRRARLERDAMEKRSALDLARMMSQVARQVQDASGRLMVTEHYESLPEPIDVDLPEDGDPVGY